MKYLILGASGDVGRALIKYIDEMEQGAVIYAHYNNGLDKINALKNQLNENNGTEIIPVKADLSSESGAREVLDALNDKNINHVIFLPAHAFNYMRLKDLDLQVVKKEMQISVYSFLEIAKELAPIMKKLEPVKPIKTSESTDSSEKTSENVETSDKAIECTVVADSADCMLKNTITAMLTKYVTDELPPKFMTDYIVSKYALMGAVKSLKVEYENKNLGVSYIAPDMIETAFLKNIDPRIIEMNKEANGGLLQPMDVAKDIYDKYIYIS